MDDEDEDFDSLLDDPLDAPLDAPLEPPLDSPLDSPREFDRKLAVVPGREDAADNRTPTTRPSSRTHSCFHGTSTGQVGAIMCSIFEEVFSVERLFKIGEPCDSK